MRTRFTRVLAVTAALAATVGLLATGDASALPAGSPSAGTPTLTPASGTSTTSINFLPPTGAACAGDSVSGGYQWQTFLVSNSVDPATLTYDANGPVVTAPAIGFPMFSAAGTPINNQSTAITTGLITPIPTFSFAALDGLIPAGVYKLGYACYQGGATQKFWVTSVSITTGAGGLITGYSPFLLPAAPVLASPLTSGNGTLAGTFTAVATPAATSFTVTAQPPAPAAAITQTLAAGATSFTFSGLTNGTTYAVSLTATNAVGTGPASNVVNGTPADPNARPAVGGLNVVPGSTTADLSWTTPTGVAPTGYTIVLSSAVVGATGTGTFTAAAGATTFQLTLLTDATAYSVSVTPVHPAPFFASPAVAPFNTQSLSSIVQDISVTRPVGGLVLTQQCGLYGALGAENADNFFGAFGALAASGTGSIPTGEVATKYAQYPYPVDALNVPIPTYPTHCALSLGIADLIRTGPEAGKYFRADGRLNQVTVVDTRNADTGWTLSGSVGNFTSGANSFSGNYLGWTPHTSGTSGVTFEGYDQQTTNGPALMPTGPAGTGLSSSQVLGSANALSGLGIASFDARMKLLIPVTADNGVYTATLTLSALPKP